MNKSSCNVTRKYKKGEVRGVAENKIRQFLNRSSRVLSVVCSKSGECMAFGRKIAEITSLFKGFAGFEYVVDPIQSIGTPSANGFIKEIVYEKNNYKSHAILKSSQKSGSDNLVYEYIVGVKYINRIMTQYPCFVQTYGLYYYDSPDNWKSIRDSRQLQSSMLKHLKPQKGIDYTMACKQSKYAAILIQHLEVKISLNAAIKVAYHSKTIVQNDLLYILFIVYHALSSLSKKFTHYDLHADNVLLYEPQKGKHIKYVYHMRDGKQIEFYTRFIPKIIDYGRSFFDNGKTNSAKIRNKICNTPGCIECGDNNGFGWLDPNSPYFICSSKKNESHDLRLLDFIREDFQTLDLHTHSAMAVDSVLKKVKYGKFLKPDERSFGTKENTMIDTSGASVSNVTDAYLQFKKHVERYINREENAKHYSNQANLLGVLNVFEDGRPMKYEPI